MTKDAPLQAAPPSPRRLFTLWHFVLLVAIFGAIVYRNVFLPGQILFTTDDNIGSMALRKALLPQALIGGWDDSALAGQVWVANLTWTNLLLLVLPVRFFTAWIHVLDLAPASIFLALYLRRRGVGWIGSGLGALTAFWLGSNFFLTYAGHIGKFAVLLFAALCLWLTERAVQRKSWGDALLAGGAMGVMFLEQADVALFFALALGAYAVYACWRDHGFNFRVLALVVLPIVATAGLLAYRPVVDAYKLFAHDARVTDGDPEKAKRELWEYCTQWSLPPEEVIEWVAPGYLGWRSGEAEGPYWGRLGQSAEWEKTRRGFQNFKLETFYLGAIPLALVGLQLFLLMTGRLSNRDRRLDAWFWLAVVLVTFLLGLGKYFPLYRAFFALPGISSIRNPVKFLQVTQVALGILAAVGIDELLRRQARGEAARALTPYLRGLLVAGGLLLLWAVGLGSASAAEQQQLASAGWGGAAPVIVENKLWAVLHASVLCFAGAALLWAMGRPASRSGAFAGARAGCFLLALVAVDQLTVSRHYVQTVDRVGLIDENPAVSYLKNSLGRQRAYFLQQDSFYGQWLTYLFPYHHISSFNVTQTRFSENYKNYLGVVGNRPALLWQTFAVGQLLGPAGYWPALQNDPVMKDNTALGFAYNVAPKGAGVQVLPSTQARPGQHVIIRHKASAPRYCLLAGWAGESPEGILARLGRTDYRPFEQALVPPDVAAQHPASTATGITGEVKVMTYRSGRVQLQAAASVPTVLRAADSYSPYWRATVDGKPATIVPCDYLFQGLFLEPGLHDVVLEFAPPLGSLWIQLAGTALCLLGLIPALRKERPATG